MQHEKFSTNFAQPLSYKNSHFPQNENKDFGVNKALLTPSARIQSIIED